MLLEGLESDFSPWTKDDIEDIKRRAFQRLKEIGPLHKAAPTSPKTVNEKEN